jgi:two-component system sensor histidine kinase SenX3
MKPDLIHENDYIPNIGENAERTLELIDNFLNLLVVEDVKPDDFRQVELLPVLETARSAMRGQAERKRIQLDIRCDRELSLPGDARLLERLFTNLIVNAIKFSPEESRITVAAEADGREIRCRVADQGCGVSPEVLSRLFDPRERDSRQKRHPGQGTGLGLMIAKAIVDLHSGRIEAASEPGHGLEITIRFPREPGE